jgi:hypothetical protein
MDAYSMGNIAEDFENEDEYLSFLVAADWQAGRRLKVSGFLQPYWEKNCEDPLAYKIGF